MGVYDVSSMAAEGEGVLALQPPEPQDIDSLAFGGSDQVCGVGDLDGDGFDEILVGEEYVGADLPDGPSVHGKVHLIRGGPRLPSPIPVDQISIDRRKVFHGRTATFRRDNFGSDVISPGDVNGDGIPDLLLGALRSSERLDRAGEAYLVYGRAEVPDDIYLAEGFEGIRILGANIGGGLGSKVGPAGDFNADGNPAFFVGEPPLSSSGTSKGEFRTKGSPT